MNKDGNYRLNVSFDGLVTDFGWVSLNKNGKPSAAIILILWKMIPIMCWCCQTDWEAASRPTFSPR